VAIVSLVYAPTRFLLDFLRLPDAEGGDLRYASLTPAQWSCIGLFVLGLLVTRHVVMLRRRGIDPASELRRGAPSVHQGG
jgi:phosphatidylglycerol---prolipoprotein diacylglyceryl transferase